MKKIIKLCACYHHHWRSFPFRNLSKDTNYPSSAQQFTDSGQILTFLLLTLLARKSNSNNPATLNLGMILPYQSRIMRVQHIYSVINLLTSNVLCVVLVLNVLGVDGVEAKTNNRQRLMIDHISWRAFRCFFFVVIIKEHFHDRFEIIKKDCNSVYNNIFPLTVYIYLIYVYSFFPFHVHSFSYKIIMSVQSQSVNFHLNFKYHQL